MKTIAVAATRFVWKSLAGAAVQLRSVLGRCPERRPAWASDVLDDIAFNRPWNLIVKVLRLRARFLQRWQRQGETIVIVNWNTHAVTRDTIAAVRALTPSKVRLLVVDNGSTDGSREWLRAQHDLRVLALPANAGHAVALDIAVLLARTDVVITLDSDAVPLRNGWLEAVTEPLARPGVVLAGTRSSRDFVHPMFAAVDVRTFVRRKLSFQVWRLPDVPDEQLVWGEDRWDTAELMTARLDPHEVAFVERTANRTDDLPGMTAGDVVYHHGGVTRATEAAMDESAEQSYGEWRRAIEMLLPPEALT